MGGAIQEHDSGRQGSGPASDGGLYRSESGQSGDRGGSQGDYRWSGYGEAVGGRIEAREGIAEAVSASYGRLLKWREASREYRQLLYCTGTLDAPQESLLGRIRTEAWIKVMEEGGQLPVAAALRCRVRYFTDGAVLGSREYVESIFTQYRDQFGSKRGSGARKMKGSDWEGLTVIRDLRREVFS